MSAPAPVLRWPGSKWRIASWIAGFFPPHDCYVDLFFGSGALFFTKEPSFNEIVNDLDGEVVNLFRVIRTRPEELAQALAFTPWARDEYLACRVAARAATELDEVERARVFVTLSQQGFGLKRSGAGNGWRVHHNQRNAASPRWGSLPEKVLISAARLANAQIENQNALQLLTRVNSPEVLVYADPPYLSGSRNSTDLYACEMGDPERHTALLEGLLSHVGPVILSHYPAPLYDRLLRGWHTVDTTARAQSNEHRTERLYINRVAWSALQLEQHGRRTPLFGDTSP